jgi:hypothetical protein
MPYKDPEKQREMARHYSAVWRAKHPERAKQINHASYLRHKAANRAQRNEYAREWFRNHPGYKKEYDSKRAPGWRLKYEETYRVDGRQKARMLRWKQKNPDKWRAHNALNEALRLGKMTKPSHCSNCAKKRKLNGHHFLGYDRKHWLSVIWLCIPCHHAAH